MPMLVTVDDEVDDSKLMTISTMIISSKLWLKHFCIVNDERDE